MPTCHPPDSVEHDGLSCMVCQDCGREEPLRFRCLAYRCEWVESHHRLTGHDRYLLGAVAWDGTLKNVAWQPLKVHVPDGHVLAMVLNAEPSWHCSCGVTLRHDLRGFPDAISAALTRAHTANAITGRPEQWRTGQPPADS